MTYRIYKNSIEQRASNNLFKYVLSVCEFYNPKLFNRKIYSKKWMDKKFISKMHILRKDKKKFSSIYKTIQISNELKKFHLKTTFIKSHLDI